MGFSAKGAFFLSRLPLTRELPSASEAEGEKNYPSVACGASSPDKGSQERGKACLCSGLSHKLQSLLSRHGQFQQNKKPGGRARNTPARFDEQIRRKQPKNIFPSAKKSYKRINAFFSPATTLAIDTRIWYTIFTSAPEIRLMVMCPCT